MATELPIIQKTYDLIKWYVPILNRLPRDHKFQLGSHMVGGLYELLEGLILARYQRDKLLQLQGLNSKLDILRHQTRLLLDFNLLSHRRYQYVGQLMNDIGQDTSRLGRNNPSSWRSSVGPRHSKTGPSFGISVSSST